MTKHTFSEHARSASTNNLFGNQRYYADGTPVDEVRDEPATCDLCGGAREVENLCADCAYWSDGNLESNEPVVFCAECHDTLDLDDTYLFDGCDYYCGKYCRS